MHRSVIGVAAAILCSGWMIFSAPPAATQELAPTSTISDQKLDQMAAAIKNVQMLRSLYTEKVAAAPPDKKDQLVGEGNAAIKKAVTDQGLSVEEYNSIVRLAQNDPSLRARIDKRLGISEK